MKFNQVARLVGYILLAAVALLSALFTAKSDTYSPLPTTLYPLLLPVPLLLLSAIPLGIGFYKTLKIKSAALRILASIAIAVIDAALFYLIFILIRILFIRLG